MPNVEKFNINLLGVNSLYFSFGINKFPFLFNDLYLDSMIFFYTFVILVPYIFHPDSKGLFEV